MSLALVIYVAGILPVAVAVAIHQERERRDSLRLVDREATLAPGLDGIVVGACWPLAVAVALALGVIALLALIGRLGAERLG